MYSPDSTSSIPYDPGISYTPDPGIPIPAAIGATPEAVFADRTPASAIPATGELIHSRISVKLGFARRRQMKPSST